MRRSSGHLEEVVFHKNQPQGSRAREGPGHQLSCRVLLHAIKLLTHVVPRLYTLSGVVHTANKETIPCVK